MSSEDQFLSGCGTVMISDQRPALNIGASQVRERTVCKSPPYAGL